MVNRFMSGVSVVLMSIVGDISLNSGVLEYLRRWLVALGLPTFSEYHRRHHSTFCFQLHVGLSVASDSSAQQCFNKFS